MNKKSNSHSGEIFIDGISASPGNVIGTAFVAQKNSNESSSTHIQEDQIDSHLQRYDDARRKLVDEWRTLKEEHAEDETGDILETQIEIIDDPVLTEQIKKFIEDEKVSAAKAIQQTFDDYVDLFSKSGSPVTTDRLADLSDIRDRLIELVEGREVSDIDDGADIIIAKELSPREIMALSQEGIKAVVTERGGSSSHAAIIARSVGMPAVVGAAGAMSQIPNQSKICLNGHQGLVIVHPGEQTCKQAKSVAGEGTLTKEEQEELSAHSLTTKDGHSFVLRGNMEFVDELALLKRYNASGVGLLRTEALYLDESRDISYPNQKSFYEDILEKTGDKPVTIRLFDIGGDKFKDENITENNPFLGWRGIRMLLDKRELLRPQLKAVLAAAGLHPGRVKILLPMVTMLSEVKEIKEEMKHCTEQLAEEGHAVDKDVSLGIMVETPSVAIQAERFAKEVDYFSIGTNDLIQYLLAVDRGNARVAKLYNQIHPVMWQMINQTIQAGHQEDCSVEVCGELASYPVAAVCLLGLNIDGLSMNPAAILPVKKLLISRRLDEMKELAAKTIGCTTLKDVETLFKNWKNKK